MLVLFVKWFVCDVFEISRWHEAPIYHSGEDLNGELLIVHDDREFIFKIIKIVTQTDKYTQLLTSDPTTKD